MVNPTTGVHSSTDEAEDTESGVAQYGNPALHV